MHDDVEEENIAEYANNKRDCDEVYNLVLPSHGVVDCADALLPAEICDEAHGEQYKPHGAERPFISSIERRCERCAEGDARETKRYENYRREAAELGDENGERR